MPIAGDVALYKTFGEGDGSILNMLYDARTMPGALLLSEFDNLAQEDNNGDSYIVG